MSNFALFRNVDPNYGNIITDNNGELVINKENYYVYNGVTITPTLLKDMLVSGKQFDASNNSSDVMHTELDSTLDDADTVIFKTGLATVEGFTSLNIVDSFIDKLFNDPSMGVYDEDDIMFIFALNNVSMVSIMYLYVLGKITVDDIYRLSITKTYNMNDLLIQYIDTLIVPNNEYSVFDYLFDKVNVGQSTVANRLFDSKYNTRNYSAESLCSDAYGITKNNLFNYLTDDVLNIKSRKHYKHDSYVVYYMDTEYRLEPVVRQRTVTYMEPKTITKTVKGPAQIILYPITVLKNVGILGFWSKITNAVKSTVNKAVGTVANVTNKVVSAVVNNPVTKAVTNVVNKTIVEPVKEVAKVVNEKVIKPAVDFVKENVVEPVKKVIKPVVDFVKEKIVEPIKEKVIEPIKEVLKPVTEYIKKVFCPDIVVTETVYEEKTRIEDYTSYEPVPHQVKKNTRNRIKNGRIPILLNQGRQYLLDRWAGLVYSYSYGANITDDDLQKMLSGIIVNSLGDRINRTSIELDAKADNILTAGSYKSSSIYNPNDTTMDKIYTESQIVKTIGEDFNPKLTESREIINDIVASSSRDISDRKYHPEVLSFFDIEVDLLSTNMYLKNKDPNDGNKYSLYSIKHVLYDNVNGYGLEHQRKDKVMSDGIYTSTSYTYRVKEIPFNETDVDKQVLLNYKICNKNSQIIPAANTLYIEENSNRHYYSYLTKALIDSINSAYNDTMGLFSNTNFIYDTNIFAYTSFAELKDVDDIKLATINPEAIYINSIATSTLNGKSFLDITKDIIGVDYDENNSKSTILKQVGPYQLLTDSEKVRAYENVMILINELPSKLIGEMSKSSKRCLELLYLLLYCHLLESYFLWLIDDDFGPETKFIPTFRYIKYPKVILDAHPEYDYNININTSGSVKANVIDVTCDSLAVDTSSINTGELVNTVYYRITRAILAFYKLQISANNLLRTNIFNPINVTPVNTKYSLTRSTPSVLRNVLSTRRYSVSSSTNNSGILPKLKTTTNKIKYINKYTDFLTSLSR